MPIENLVTFERFIKLRKERATKASVVYAASSRDTLGFTVLKKVQLEIFKSGVAIATLWYSDGSYRVALSDVTHTNSPERPRWKGTYTFSDGSSREAAFWTYEDNAGKAFIQFEHRESYFGEQGTNFPELPINKLFS